MDNVVLNNKETVRKMADLPVFFNNVSFLMIDYFVILLFIILSLNIESTFVYVASVVVIGSRMRALMNLLHESSHNCLIIDKPKLNKLIGEIFCAFPIFTTHEVYRESHMRHHVHFGDINKDPDMERYNEVFGKDIAINGGSKYDYLKTIFSVKNFINYSYLHPLRKALNLKVIVQYKYMSIFWIAMVVIFYSSGVLPFVLIYWIIPYLTIFKLICYVAELFEHFGLYSTNDDLTNTRNIYVNKVLSSIVWPHGDNYHLVHHLFAFVPGYQLKNVDKYLCHVSSDYSSRRSFYAFSDKAVSCSRAL